MFTCDICLQVTETIRNTQFPVWFVQAITFIAEAKPWMLYLFLTMVTTLSGEFEGFSNRHQTKAIITIQRGLSWLGLVIAIVDVLLGGLIILCKIPLPWVGFILCVTLCTLQYVWQSRYATVGRSKALFRLLLPLALFGLLNALQWAGLGTF